MPDEHRPERPVFLAVDRQLGEGATRLVPEPSRSALSLEVGQHDDVEQFGAGSGAERPRRSRVGAQARRVSWPGELRRSTVVPSIAVPAQVHSRTLAHHGSPYPDRPFVPVSSALAT